MKLYDLKSKIIKTVATVISVILLFQNWVTVYGDFKYDWFTGYREEFVREAWAFTSFASWLGDQFDVRGFENAVDCILDGKCSAIEMSMIAAEMDGIALYLNETGTATGTISMIKVFFVGYLLMLLLAGASAVILLYYIWKKSETKYENLFFAAEILLFGMFCIVCLSTSSVTTAFGTTQLFMIRPTLPAIFSVLFAVPTEQLQKLPIYDWKIFDVKSVSKTVNVVKRQIPIVESTFKPVRNSAERLICGSCGCRIDGDSRFCSFCGCEMKD